MFTNGTITATVVGQKLMLEDFDILTFLEEHNFTPTKSFEQETIMIAQKVTGLSTTNILKLKETLDEMGEKELSSILAYLKPQLHVGGQYYNPPDYNVLDPEMKIKDIIKIYNIDKAMDDDLTSEALAKNKYKDDILKLIKKKQKIANDDRPLKEDPGAIKRYNKLDVLLASRLKK